MRPPAHTIAAMREPHERTQGLQFQALDRRAPPPAQAARGQQAGVHRQRVHHHGRGRSEQPQGFPRRSGRGILLPARGRHHARHHAGRPARRHSHRRRRDLPAAAQPAALAAPARRTPWAWSSSARAVPANATASSGTARTAAPGSTRSSPRSPTSKRSCRRSSSASSASPRIAPAATAARCMEKPADMLAELSIRRAEGARRARSRREPRHRGGIRRAGPAALRRRRAQLAALRRRQFFRQRRQRRLRQLLDASRSPRIAR